MSRAVTMKDVAAAAGVGVKTVSNVVNNRDDQMTPATKRRVQEVMARLGYELNHSARSLKRGRTGVIGLAVPGFGQPMIGYFADQVATAVRDRGYEIVLSMFEKLEHNIDQFAQHAPQINADGWIIFPDHPMAPDAPALHQSYPMVSVGDFTAHGLIDHVTMRTEESGQNSTKWLLDGNPGTDSQRPVTVAFIGAPEDLFTRFPDDEQARLQAATNATEGLYLRLKGYLTALAERGIEPDWSLIEPCETITQLNGQKATLALAERMRALGHPMPDALLCSNDAVAIGALAALTGLGIDVPNQVEVLGYDALPDGQYTAPALSTCDPNIPRFASLAVDALIERINGDDQPPRTLHVDTTLLPRATTRPR